MEGANGVKDVVVVDLEDGREVGWEGRADGGWRVGGWHLGWRWCGMA